MSLDLDHIAEMDPVRIEPEKLAQLIARGTALYAKIDSLELDLAEAKEELSDFIDESEELLAPLSKEEREEKRGELRRDGEAEEGDGCD